MTSSTQIRIGLLILAALASTGFCQDCASTPCLEGGTCVEGNSTSGYICQCPLTGTSLVFTGQNCEIQQTVSVESIGCSLNFYTSEGNVTTPNYPNEYSEKLNCYYHIKVGSASSITLIVEECYLEEDNKDEIYIAGGPTVSTIAPGYDLLLNANITASNTNLTERTYTYTGSQVTLYLDTDKNVHYRGCRISYSADVDECNSDPCQNGGTCMDGDNSYTCTCVPGYNGDNCQNDINECASMPCQNGGTCNDGINMYNCTCAAGFTGTNCMTDINECASMPCQNGGTCNDGINMYNCTCAAGFTGTNCMTNINECASMPCQNGGTCNDGINMYNCTCAAGFTGTNCMTQMNECSSMPCQNGGTCVDGTNVYLCSCQPGYTDPNCGTDINECASSPCQNGGTCTDEVNSYSCSCVAGYEGPTCGIDTDECASGPCQNGGTCNDQVNMYTCNCAAGYTDSDCQTDINECASSPCQNGATCDDMVNAYSCMCLPEYTGVNCEDSLDACASDPCLNGSTCTNVGTDFECECLPGFSGTLCDIDINECATLPCQNGGTCINELAGHSCVCQYGYTGATCEEYTLCDLEGVWYNSRNDQFTLQKTATGVIFGTYRTRGHILAGVTDISLAFGYSVLTGEYPIPTFGLTLVRDFGRSTTCWTGQCQVCDGQEILYSTWINTQAVSTCDEIHLATRIGQDEWTRYQQLRAPQES